ncbi:TBL2 isoform 5 [Pongo abelii]|uniref:TBL2 isoform 5 n=1 Tax=Pongo abelii TaxID=9601 RepID=A0A2J8XV08_PONAB|nr:TBL2 isoform 5 [Pongo abelii]
MELSQMTELMGLSVLLGLLALMATAAVARGWLRAGEERSGRPAWPRSFFPVGIGELLQSFTTCQLCDSIKYLIQK